ncbi:MAG: histidine kinase [Clostridia bacterium]|nr:histidine kinase [Clostridia bacterium]
MNNTKSYKNHLTVIICFGLFLSYSCLAAICIRIYNKSIYQMIDKNVSAALSDSKRNIDKTIDSVYTTSGFLIQYSTLNNILASESAPDMYFLLSVNSELYNVLGALSTNIDISNIKIYTNNPNVYSMNIISKGIPFDNDFINKLSNTPTPIWIITEKNSQQYFSFYQKYSTNNHYYNILEIAIPFSALQNNISEIEYENAYVVFNHDNFSDVIFCNGDKNSESNIAELNSKNSYIFTKNLNNITGSINIYINKYNIVKRHTYQYMQLFFLLLLGFIIMGILCYIIYKRMTACLEAIVNAILKDDFKSIENLKNNFSEFEIICDYFIQLKKTLAEENQSRLSLEMSILSQRLSPHFLYNNLSAIKYADSSEKTEQIIDSLILYYRNTFQKGSDFCTLTQEMTGLLEYLKLLSVSYENPFDYSIDLSNEASFMMVPSNILQPFVENAFIHGINTLKDKKGFIYISAELADNAVRIVITDNAGTFCSNNLKQNNSGSAISIIEKRLSLYYGNSYNIDFISTDEETNVILTLPAGESNAHISND